MLVRAEAIAGAGYMDERFFLYSEETDLCLRIAEAGWRVVYSPRMTILHHAGKAGVNPKLEAQKAFARCQYAAKHFNRLGNNRPVSPRPRYPLRPTLSRSPSRRSDEAPAPLGGPLPADQPRTRRVALPRGGGGGGDPAARGGGQARALGGGPVRIVVVASFLNEEELLPRFLASVRAQSRTPDRLLLVDDGSVDSSPDIAAEFAREHDFAGVLIRPPRPAEADRLANAGRAARVRVGRWANRRAL